MGLELDKIRTEFDDMIDMVRAEAPVRPKKPGLLRRTYGARRYEYRFDHGQAVDRRRDGFGLETARLTFFVRSLPKKAPPLDTDLLVVSGWITWSFGRPVRRPRPVLLGYAGEETGVVYTRANWAELHGRPMVKWLILLPVFALSVQAMVTGSGQGNIVLLFLAGSFIWLYLMWPVFKLWQVASARYAFRAQVSRLHRYLGE